MRIVSWNVNGIRSILDHGLLDWLASESADLVCLQEVKAPGGQIPPQLRNHPGWSAHWNLGQRPGYSGTGILVRRGSLAEPFWVEPGFGVPRYEVEGRTLVAELGDLLLVCAYFPKGYEDDPERMAFKLDYTRDMVEWVKARHAEGRAVILTGDFNIAHRDIDLAHPHQNRRTSGFLPEERALVDAFLDAGLVDAFRAGCAEGGHYTWWNTRFAARDRNLGWRIDYFLVSRALMPRVCGAAIHPDVMGSDHCPISLDLSGI